MTGATFPPLRSKDAPHRLISSSSHPHRILETLILRGVPADGRGVKEGQHKPNTLRPPARPFVVVVVVVFDFVDVVLFVVIAVVVAVDVASNTR